MFKFLKNKEEEKVAKRYIDDMTEDEIAKYLESKKAKEPSEQTEKDRVDESVAMQERDSGTEDSQSAKDRVDESLGALRADERREERREDDDGEERFRRYLEPVMKRMDEMREEIAAMKRAPEPAEKSVAEKLSALEKRFNN